MGPTLPTSMSPQVLGPNLINPLPPPPPTARTARDPDRSDAMAAEVERFVQQKEKEKKQYKAVLKQKDNELAQAREHFQRDLDQSKADHQEHLKRIETKINEAASSHETQHQRSHRYLELRAPELAAKNAAVEEELTLRQPSQEEKEMARALLLSQKAESAIDVDADHEVEQLINASSQGEEQNTTSTQQDWNATPREGAASQSSNQPEVTSPAPNSVPTGKVPQESASPHSAGKTGKRTRGPAKTKSPAVKEREELPPPDVASVTPPDSAKEVSSSSGETKKAKGPRTNQKSTAGQQNLDEYFARAQGSEL